MPRSAGDDRPRRPRGTRPARRWDLGCAVKEARWRAASGDVLLRILPGLGKWGIYFYNLYMFVYWYIYILYIIYITIFLYIPGNYGQVFVGPSWFTRTCFSSNGHLRFWLWAVVQMVWQPRVLTSCDSLHQKRNFGPKWPPNLGVAIKHYRNI